MAGQKNDEAEGSGNRRGYEGDELLQVLWVLLEYTDEEHPLAVKEIRRKAQGLYGEDVVPGEKKIRNCIKAIRKWSDADGKRDRADLARKFSQQDGATEGVYHPAEAPVVESKKIGKTICYYVKKRRRGRDEVATLIDAFAAFVNVLTSSDFGLKAELLPYEVENRLPSAGAGNPDGPQGWSPQDILAMVERLRDAIDRKKAISYYKIYAIPAKKLHGRSRSGDIDDVMLDRPADGPKDENRVAISRWPYALRAMDGRLFVLVNATGGRDKLAPVPIDEMAELHVIDPEDPTDIYDEPIEIKPKMRPELDDLVEDYFNGAVCGWGSTKPKVTVRLLCKGDGFRDACKRFGELDFKFCENTVNTCNLNGLEAAMRPKNKTSREANPWYEVTFRAHPYGVELWAKQRPRDVVLLEPKREAARVKSYITDSRYDFGAVWWDKQIRRYDNAGGAVSSDLLAIGGLAEDEKKLIAAYRDAKAKAEEETAKRNRGKE